MERISESFQAQIVKSGLSDTLGSYASKVMFDTFDGTWSEVEETTRLSEMIRCGSIILIDGKIFCVIGDPKNSIVRRFFFPMSPRDDHLPRRGSLAFTEIEEWTFDFLDWREGKPKTYKCAGDVDEMLKTNKGYRGLKVICF